MITRKGVVIQAKTWKYAINAGAICANMVFALPMNQSNPHSLLAHTVRLRLCWAGGLGFMFAGHCARRVKGCPPVPVRAGAPASHGDHEQEAPLTHTEQDLAVQCPLCNAPVGFRCCNIKLPNAERREPHRRRMYIGVIHAKQEADNGLQEFC